MNNLTRLPSSNTQVSGLGFRSNSPVIEVHESELEASNFDLNIRNQLVPRSKRIFNDGSESSSDSWKQLPPKINPAEPEFLKELKRPSDTNRRHQSGLLDLAGYDRLPKVIKPSNVQSRTINEPDNKVSSSLEHNPPSSRVEVNQETKRKMIQPFIEKSDTKNTRKGESKAKGSSRSKSRKRPYHRKESKGKGAENGLLKDLGEEETVQGHRGKFSNQFPNGGNSGDLHGSNTTLTTSQLSNSASMQEGKKEKIDPAELSPKPKSSLMESLLQPSPPTSMAKFEPAQLLLNKQPLLSLGQYPQVNAPGQPLGYPTYPTRPSYLSKMDIEHNWEYSLGNQQEPQNPAPFGLLGYPYPTYSTISPPFTNKSHQYAFAQVGSQNQPQQIQGISRNNHHSTSAARQGPYPPERPCEPVRTSTAVQLETYLSKRRWPEHEDLEAADLDKPGLLQVIQQPTPTNNQIEINDDDVLEVRGLSRSPDYSNFETKYELRLADKSTGKTANSLILQAKAQIGPEIEVPTSRWLKRYPSKKKEFVILLPNEEITQHSEVPPNPATSEPSLLELEIVSDPQAECSQLPGLNIWQVKSPQPPPQPEADSSTDIIKLLQGKKQITSKPKAPALNQNEFKQMLFKNMQLQEKGILSKKQEKKRVEDKLKVSMSKQKQLKPVDGAAVKRSEATEIQKRLGINLPGCEEPLATKSPRPKYKDPTAARPPLAGSPSVAHTETARSVAPVVVAPPIVINSSRDMSVINQEIKPTELKPLDILASKPSDVQVESKPPPLEQLTGIGSRYNTRRTNIIDFYDMGKQLGEGGNSIVREIFERGTREKYALKTTKPKCEGKYITREFNML